MNVTDLYNVSLDDASWRKSSYTANNDQCVEIAELGALPAVAVRDSKNPHLPASRVSQAAWRQFIAAAKAGGHVQA
ncbi:DUF397 domain-containing protein [Streptomyces sp. SID3343]|nr:DUF397 domain-containing protein [Streptomyces sp. SID3343]MYW03842.1 DUF397 domain-containing protein [Streptomyces sp. SID3343]